MEYYFEFNYEKNRKLIEERAISFEQVISIIQQGGIINIIEHPNQDRYPNQKIYVMEVDNYCYLVPHMITENEIFLKTIISSRNATKEYIQKNNKVKNNKHFK